MIRYNAGFPGYPQTLCKVWHMEPVFVYITSEVDLPVVEKIVTVLGSVLSLPSSQLPHHIPISTVDIIDTKLYRLAFTSEQAINALLYFMRNKNYIIDPITGVIISISTDDPLPPYSTQSYSRTRDEIRTELIRILSLASAPASASTSAPASASTSAQISSVPIPVTGYMGRLTELKSPDQVKFTMIANEAVVESRTSTSIVYTGTMVKDSGSIPVNMKVLLGQGAETVATECYPLSRLSHNSISKIFGITQVPGTRLPVEYGVVMEKTGFNLGKQIKSFASASASVTFSVPLNTRLRMFYEIAEAVAYLHSQKMYHTNIKTEMIGYNDLISPAKIIDITPVLQESIAVVTKSMRGSPMYMCPELATGKISVGMATDVFSLGITLWELIELKLPYKDLIVASVDDFFGHVLAGRRPGTEENMIRTISTNGFTVDQATVIAKLVCDCWNTGNQSRPSSLDIITVLKPILFPVSASASASAPSASDAV
jgi:hypothetical protein